jgi:hypothetical protein
MLLQPSAFISAKKQNLEWINEMNDLVLFVTEDLKLTKQQQGCVLWEREREREGLVSWCLVEGVVVGEFHEAEEEEKLK